MEQHPGPLHTGVVEVTRRVEDLSSGQYLDAAADTPTFDVPSDMDPDSLLAALDIYRDRLLYPRTDGSEGVIHSPELKRLDRRRHDERCLITTGAFDPRGHRAYWICRVER